MLTLRKDPFIGGGHRILSRGAVTPADDRPYIGKRYTRKAVKA